MSSPPSKKELLKAISVSWAELNEAINSVSKEQLTQPGVQGNWSVKDVMAHIAAWKRLAMDRIQAATTGESLKFPVIKGDDFVDTFNADIYQTHKDQPLDEVITEFHAAYNEFNAQIEALDEELLFQNLPFDWAGNLTYQVLISANTHWHYPEHIDAILK